MKLYLVAMWFAVAVNVAATIFSLWKGYRYTKAYDEIEALIHDLRNHEALLREHTPVERN